MAPEQEKKLVELLERHVHVQKWILAALAMQGIVIVGVGGFVFLQMIGNFFRYGA